MTDWRREAARDNARWCDLMCRAHGLTGTFTDLAWTSPVRTPPFYPDAVTLSPVATAADLLPHLDAGPGASIKDSFAALDLPGFDVLFEAQWIHRDAPGRTTTDWRVVRDEATLAEWERACGMKDLFLPPLLDPPNLDRATIVHAPDLSSGAVLTATGRAVGVSNVFGDWAGVLAAAAELFPGRPLVGYESDPAPALRHGFTTTGPLRVWLRA